MFWMVPFFIVLMSACNRHKDEAGYKGNIPTASGSTCYLFAQNRDTIALTLSVNEGMVHGLLSFLFYEKDKSRGTVEGEMKGDTLIVGYEFTSEGTLSYRQVAFLKKDTVLIMGSGEILNRDNQEVFKDPSKIDFTGGVVLHQTPCR